MHRRLAAVLSADVVGYDRLVRDDEADTLARLARLNTELIEPAVAAHEGRIVKPLGDSLLAEFVTAVEAVRCAVEVQRTLAALDGDLDQSAPIELRMGVNLGDVHSEGGDITGDGVRIAARMEHLVEPGGLCITSTVLGQVRGRVDVAYEDLGRIEVEGIPGPVHVFRVLLDPNAVRQATPRTGQKPWFRQWPMLVLILAAMAFLVSAGLWLFARNPAIEPMAPERIEAPVPYRP